MKEKVSTIGHVYVIDAGDGRCKIGASKNPVQRIKTVAMSAGVKVKRSFTSELVINHYKLESLVKNCFSGKNTSGEWYLIDFDCAVCEVINNQKIATREKLSDFYKQEKESKEKMLKTVDLITKAIPKKTSNLFAIECLIEASNEYLLPMDDNFKVEIRKEMELAMESGDLLMMMLIKDKIMTEFIKEQSKLIEYLYSITTK